MSYIFGTLMILFLVTTACVTTVDQSAWQGGVSFGNQGGGSCGSAHKTDQPYKYIKSAKLLVIIEQEENILNGDDALKSKFALAFKDMISWISENGEVYSSGASVSADNAKGRLIGIIHEENFLDAIAKVKSQGQVSTTVLKNVDVSKNETNLANCVSDFNKDVKISRIQIEYRWEDSVAKN